MDLSNTPQYINLDGVTIGLVVLRGPIHLRACVSEKSGDGEGAGCDNEEMNVGWMLV